MDARDYKINELYNFIDELVDRIEKLEYGFEKLSEKTYIDEEKQSAELT